ncbi:hypothetical protein [Hydrogenimonas sp.]
MEKARPAYCKARELPSKRTTVYLDRTFSPQEMERIRRGLVSMGAEEKWFIYWRDDRLFFHHSWTGYCIYIVYFSAEGNGNYRMIKADVNRDPEQYKETGDERDAKLISVLIDAFLLRQEAVSSF